MFKGTNVLLICREMQVKNHSEMPLIPVRMAIIKKKTKDNKRNWSPCTLLVVMENGAGAVENSMEVPQKITDRTTI